MSGYYGRWAPYVSVAERRVKAEREMAKLRKRGAAVSPVKIAGRKIATTFWGKAWCDNLEGYHDYENRLPRGRSYLRNGLVVDLQIAARKVTAMVSGSRLYTVKISIDEVAKARWKALCGDCSGGIDSVVELLQGRFSKGVMERICRQDTGLFPAPSEILFTCSCPDYASMCKHVAAALYGVGARLDEQPELLFRLRAVDPTELLTDLGAALPGARKRRDQEKTLADDDLAALFDLDMAEGEPPAAPPPARAASRGRRGKPPNAAAAGTAAAAAKSTPAKAKAARPAPKRKPTRAGSAPRKPASGPAKRRRISISDAGPG